MFPALLAAALLAADAQAGGLAKSYPELAGRKDSLGAVTLLVESAVVSDVDGKVKRVELADSRKLADTAVESFRRGLEARGYQVDRALVASLGGMLNPAAEYTVRGDLPGDSARADSLRSSHAPFYLDPTLAGDPALGAAWGGTCDRLLGYARGRNKTPDYIAEPIRVADSLGARVIGVVIIYNWRVPKGKQFRQGILTGLLTLGTVTAYKTSVTRTEFALVDGRSGEILWADYGFQQVNETDEAVQKFAAASVKSLP